MTDPLDELADYLRDMRDERNKWAVEYDNNGNTDDARQDREAAQTFGRWLSALSEVRHRQVPREPSVAMLRAAADRNETIEAETSYEYTYSELWLAMYDAALAKDKTP